MGGPYNLDYSVSRFIGGGGGGNSVNNYRDNRKSNN